MPFSAMLNGIHAFTEVFFRIEKPFGLSSRAATYRSLP